MLCSPISGYPEKIDPLIFFQDVDLEKQKNMQEYNNLIAKGEYNKANEYISKQEICGYFADYFNAIENRIYNLQGYLLTIEPKQPFIISNSEPAVNDEVIWI